MRREVIAVLRQTRDLLSFHRELGLGDYPRSRALEVFLHGEPAAEAAHGTPREQNKSGAATLTAAAHPRAARPVMPAITLEELGRELAACRQCPLAGESKSRLTGEGGPGSGLLIIADHDPTAEGEPAGTASSPAGALLTRMLGAIGLTRDSVYVTFIPKCLVTRKVLPNELRQCLLLLHREIEVLAPRVICTLGPSAARTVLGTDTPLFKLRGRFHPFLNLPLMPTFHPGFLLRNPEMKKAAWLDLLAIQKQLATGG